ncbi:hypothetical protein CVT24_001372, partial [Panaeolus cyanescens]
MDVDSALNFVDIAAAQLEALSQPTSTLHDSIHAPPTEEPFAQPTPTSGYFPQPNSFPSAPPDANDHEQNRDMLWRAVLALGRSMENMNMNSNSQQQALSALVHRIADRPSTTGSGAPKHREPRVFNGRTDQLDAFLREVNNASTSNVALFPLIVIVRFTLDSTLAMELPLPALVQAFKSRFQDPDQYASAIRKMRKLRQTGSCAAFTNQYAELLAELDWSEQTKIQEYYVRLKDGVKITLCNRKG